MRYFGTAPLIPRLLAGLLILAQFTVVNADQGLEIEQVSDSVYAVVGPFGNRAPENLGNNASLNRGFKGCILLKRYRMRFYFLTS